MKKLYLVSVLVLPIASGFGMDDRPGGTESFSSETMIALKFVHDAKQDSTTTASDEIRMVPEKYVVCSEQLRGDLEFSDQKPDFLLLDRKVKDFDTLATYFPQIHAITTAPDANKKKEREQRLVSALQLTSQNELGVLFSLADYLKIESMVACGATEIKSRLRSPQLLLQYYKGCPPPDEGYGLPEPIRREFFFDILKDLVPLISMQKKEGCSILPDNSFPPTIKTMVYSHDGKFIITGDSHGRIAIVRGDGTKPKVLTPPFAAHVYGVSSMALSADDATLITAGKKLDVSIWKTNSFKEINVSVHWPVQSIQLTGRFPIIALSKEGILALGSFGGRTNLYHQEGEEFKKMQALPESTISPVAVTALLFSENGATLFSGYSNGVIELFRPVNGVWQHLKSFDQLANLKPICALAGSRHDDVAVVLGDVLGIIPQPQHHGDLHVLANNHSQVKSLACSPDGNTLVTVSKWVGLWSRDKEGNFRWSQKFGKRDNITASAFSPDGKKLATGNEKGILEIFELSSKPLETTLQEKASLRDLLLLTYVMRHQNSECPHNNEALLVLYKQFLPEVKAAVKNVLSEESCLVCKD